LDIELSLKTYKYLLHVKTQNEKCVYNRTEGENFKEGMEIQKQSTMTIAVVW
jgi:hypothetical protein